MSIFITIFKGPVHDVAKEGEKHGAGKGKGKGGIQKKNYRHAGGNGEDGLMLSAWDEEKKKEN